MSGHISNKSATSNGRAFSSETKLFGEMPLSDSDNNSTVLRLSQSSIMSDDGDHIQVSDMEEDKNDDGNIVNAKNNLNTQKSNGQPANGTTISPYYKNINNNAIETIAVIDIDGDGEYYIILYCYIRYFVCLSINILRLLGQVTSHLAKNKACISRPQNASLVCLDPRWLKLNVSCGILWNRKWTLAGCRVD